MLKKSAGAREGKMELMLAVMLLLGAAILGAWRLESEFDRESRLQPASEPTEPARYRFGVHD